MASKEGDYSKYSTKELDTAYKCLESGPKKDEIAKEIYRRVKAGN